jgi:hypothetical protein
MLLTSKPYYLEENCMTGSDTTEEKLAEHMEAGVLGSEKTPDPNQNDSIVHDLWGGEVNWDPNPKEELNTLGTLDSPDTSDNLKFELESLTIERERLRQENRKLAEMLESIKLEEDIASLKEEVSILAGENEQLLAEIQRRRQ